MSRDSYCSLSHRSVAQREIAYYQEVDADTEIVFKCVETVERN